MRSAESNRPSTCKFADRLAKLSISKFKEICPNDLLESIHQTVISAYIMEDSLFTDKENNLSVVAFGLGTKFMSKETLKKYFEFNKSFLIDKKLIIDSHAGIKYRLFIHIHINLIYKG